MIGLGLLLGGVAMFGAGRVLVRVDPLPASPVDAIFVLGGTPVDRWLQAVEIYRQVGAARILISGGHRDAGEDELAAQGIVVPSEADIGLMLMTTRLGVPASIVEVLPDAFDNTAHEAEGIVERASAEGWLSLVIITSRSATRRAGYAFERVLPDHVTVIVRDTRFDTYDPVWWWRTRLSFRQTFYEFPKVVAYWLGLSA